MKTYRIFKHSNGKIVALKNGWSWPAFFFSLPYCFFVRLWAVGLFILIAIINVSVMTYAYFVSATYEAKVTDTVADLSISPTFVLFYGGSYVLICLVLALTANTMRGKKLVKRGFMDVAQVQATSAHSATQNFQRQN